MRTVARRFLVPVLVLLAAGCGPDGPKCVPVSGKVTLDGGKVPGPGFIYFTTDGSGKEGISRPGTAEFDTEGNYRAMTFAPGDGLLPGKYLLRVDCWKTAPNLEGKPTVSFLPQRYQNAAQSKLELTVEPGAKPVTYNIELSSK
ncbi:MAG: hypothetical protein J0I06_26170 [Planctomycetes bacterium]|nr:hypothetical protein [Planctomycetota bacterium]